MPTTETEKPDEVQGSKGWTVSLLSVTVDSGQGTGEGLLELTLSFKFDAGPGTLPITSKVGGPPNLPGYARFSGTLLTKLGLPEGESSQTFRVTVDVVDRDGTTPFGRKEIAPDDTATATATWNLLQGSNSSLVLTARIPEIGSLHRATANVIIRLGAQYDVWKVIQSDSPERIEP